MAYLRVGKFSDIFDIIIPIFNVYCLKNVKWFDFIYFKDISEIVKNNNHLTSVGLEQIKKIKDNMNKW
jgi:hypothetical protein